LTSSTTFYYLITKSKCYGIDVRNTIDIIGSKVMLQL